MPIFLPPQAHFAGRRAAVRCRRNWFMRLTHRRALVFSLLSLACTLAFFTALPAASADDEVLDNKFLPAPRELLQRLSRGRLAVQQKEFNVAVEGLGEILSPDVTDDDPNSMQD